MAFDYFYGQEDAEQFLFYRIPKTLITGEEFREVSVEAKLLYGLMLDRLSLSMKTDGLMIRTEHTSFTQWKTS